LRLKSDSEDCSIVSLKTKSAALDNGIIHFAI
jgi:hypothetical protein